METELDAFIKRNKNRFLYGLSESESLLIKPNVISNQKNYAFFDYNPLSLELKLYNSLPIETFEIEGTESFEYQSEIKEEIIQVPITPKPEPEIVEIEPEPVIDELSADRVHIDSLPDPEKERVLVRTAASIEIGERIIPPRAVGKVTEVTFDDQWLLRVETVLNGSVITFTIPFSDCYLEDIST